MNELLSTKPLAPKAAKVMLLLVVALLFCFKVNSEQIKFNKTLINGIYQFHYQWNDQFGQQQEIEFALSRSDIFNRFRSFGVYQPKLASEYVGNALRRHYRKKPIPGVNITFNKENSSYQVNIRGSEQALIDKAAADITQQESLFNKKYLSLKYYSQFLTPNQVSAIKPDHARIANESVQDFKAIKPIILEKASIKNIRKVTNYVLGFVQSIPYSTLESRVNSSGAGFVPPLKLLWGNKGDCDSKVTLTASLLRALMPRIKMALVFIDNHALIGIDIPPEGDDVVATHNGVSYVLAEPTGPALFTLGTVAPESKQAIYSGQYSLETYHVNNKQTL